MSLLLLGPGLMQAMDILYQWFSVAPIWHDIRKCLLQESAPQGIDINKTAAEWHGSLGAG